jgi:hypothetical protein
MAVGLYLLVGRKIRRGRIFHRPELVPTGTGNGRSRIGRAATEDHALIPVHSKGRLDEAIGWDGRDAPFAQYLLSQEPSLLVVRGRPPGFPPFTGSIRVRKET